MAAAYTCVIGVGKVKSLIVPASILCVSLAISGCTIGGGAINDTFSTSAISIADTTPSIANDPFQRVEPSDDATATDRLLDEDTIRLAVTAADLDKIGAQGLPWANEATGSTGTITNVAQRNEAGQACRSFEASRDAYDGVTLYKGDVCLDKRSGWWTRVMRPLGQG